MLVSPRTLLCFTLLAQTHATESTEHEQRRRHREAIEEENQVPSTDRQTAPGSYPLRILYIHQTNHTQRHHNHNHNQSHTTPAKPTPSRHVPWQADTNDKDEDGGEAKQGRRRPAGAREEKYPQGIPVCRVQLHGEGKKCCLGVFPLVFSKHFPL